MFQLTYTHYSDCGTNEILAIKMKFLLNHENHKQNVNANPRAWLVQ